MPSPTVCSANRKTRSASSASAHSLASDLSSNLLSQSPNIMSQSSRMAVGRPAAAAAAATTTAKSTNICRKSYAATLSRPSYNSTTIGEQHKNNSNNVARKRSANNSTKKTGEESSDESSKIAVNAAADGGKKKGGMFRTYAKSYAKPTEHKQQQQQLSRRNKSRLARKLERGWSKSPTPRDDAKKKSPDTNSSSSSSDAIPFPKNKKDDAPIDIDPHAPTKFRESYESKNAHSEKNLRNIEAIAKMQEDALHISTMVEIPVLQVQIDGEEDGDGGDGEGGRVEFSPLTCPASQPAWDCGRDSDGDDDDGEGDAGDNGDERVALESGRQQRNDDVADDNIMQHSEQEGKLKENEGMNVEQQAEKVAAFSGEKLDTAMMKRDNEENKGNGDINENESSTYVDWQHDADDHFSVEEEEIVPSTFEERKPPAKPSDSNKATPKKTGEQDVNRLIGRPKSARKRPTRTRKGATALALASEQADHADSQKGNRKFDFGWHSQAESRYLDDEEDERKPPAKPSPAKKVISKETCKGNNRLRKQPPKAVKKRPIRKRKGAVALALAVEYEEDDNVGAEHEKEDEEEQPHAAKKKGRKRKQGPTAQALAEYDETGEVDSYFDKRAAERRGKKALEKQQEECGEMDTSHVDEDEDYGHTSFHSDDDEPIGTARASSEPLLSSSAPDHPTTAVEAATNGTEKQSEPLLSSAVPEPSTAATAASTAASAESKANNASANTESNTRTTTEMIVALRNEVDQMGRALICPICQSTLKQAKILPCVHAFCSGCLIDYFNPKPTINPKTKRLQPCKVKNECPVCKASNRGRRSGVLAPHLDELVLAYKGIGRAFGFAPVVYGADIVMTQLDPEENGGFNMESEDDEEEVEGKMPVGDDTNEVKRKLDSNMHEYGQHLQVCQTVHGAFLERTESLQLQHKDRPSNRREEIEKQNQVRRLQLLAKEQEAVVAVDEKAFNKVKRVAGTKEMLAANTAKFLAEAAKGEREAAPIDNDKRSGKDNESSAKAKSNVFDKPKTDEMQSERNDVSDLSGKIEASNAKRGKAEKSIGTVVSAAGKIEYAKASKLEPAKAKDETSAAAASDIASGKKPVSTAAGISGEAKKKSADEALEAGGGINNSVMMENSSATPFATNETDQAEAVKHDKLSPEEEDEFCTAPDESQSLAYSTAREESQGTASIHVTAPINVKSVPSPILIHDGNTVKKATKPQQSLTAASRDKCVLDLEKRLLSSEKPSVGRRKSPRAAASTSASSIQASARESIATVATSRSNISPIVLHDGNTARKIRHDDRPKKSIPAVQSLPGEESKVDNLNNVRTNRHNKRKKPSPRVSLDQSPTPRRSGRMPPVSAAAVVANRGSTKEDNALVHIDGGADKNLPTPKLGESDAAASSPPTPIERQVEEEKENIIAKGTIVFIQSRTWPGINKPGGVARVTKVHNFNNSTKYDVTYILGGKEKQVEESFVTLHEVDALEAVDEECPNDSRTARVSMSPEIKSRLIRRRKAAVAKTDQSTSPPGRGVASGIPIYSDEELKHIPADVLKWAGIVPKEKRGKAKAAAEGGKKEASATRGKKRVLTESDLNAEMKPIRKKQNTASATPAKKGCGGKSAKQDRDSSPATNAKSKPDTKKQKTATIPAKKRGSRKSSDPDHDPSVANVKLKSAKKKHKSVTTTPAKKKGGGKSSQQDHDPPLASEGLRGVIGLLSNEEIVSLADTRYSSVLSLDKKPSKTESVTLHAVTSSLTDKDSKMLDSLCKMLKGKNVVLKITKDFNPKKTQLCITAAAVSSSRTSAKNRKDEPIMNVVSKSRTLKVMRSALSGIPILTPQWMESCLKKGGMVAPTGNMCTRTLPRKQAASAGSEERKDVSTEHFGVAKYAAAFQKISSLSSCHLFSGVSVMLCGSSAGPGMTKDLKVLLQQAGASIISSVSMASRLLTDMSREEGGSLGPFVLLCDDSLTDKGCGISDALFKQVKKLIGDSPSSDETKEARVLCVHFTWLFDSISCATPMKATAYEPLAPRPKALWDLTTEKETLTATNNRTESQTY